MAAETDLLLVESTRLHDESYIRSSRQPWGGRSAELEIALESFIIEINPSTHHKGEDNIIITPQVSRFYFSICFLSLHHMAVYACACFSVLHVRGSK